MAADAFNQMTHATNRQFNRQNPAFDHRPLDCYHLATNARWPEPQRWHYTAGENANDDAGRYPTSATAARVARRGVNDQRNGRRRRRPSPAPRHDLALTPELLLAALENDDAKIKDLVTRGAWPECRTESGATPLICAAAKGSGGAIEALLEAGANPLASDAVGATCLVLAAFHGRLATVTRILDLATTTTTTTEAASALLRCATHGGETPVMAAAKAGHAHVVRELMERMRGDAGGEGCFDGGDARGLTAMALACRNGHADVVEVLLGGGATDEWMGHRSGPHG